MSLPIGPHVINVTDAALTWTRHAAIVKTLYGQRGAECLQVFEAAPDSAIRVFRRFFDSQSWSRPGQDVANDILSALTDYRHRNLYVELYNETGTYADLIAQAVPVLHAAGVKVCGPSWGTGAYWASDWDDLRMRRWCGLDAIALHAYWSPQVGPTIWNAYRWRQFWEPGDPSVLITEVGHDIVRDGPNDTYIGQGGWKKNGVDGAAYVRELSNYATEIARDAYVLGATVFTAGASDDWQDYQTDGLDVSPLYSAVVPAPPVPTPNPGGNTMSEQEFLRWAADVFKRANVPWNPASGFAKHWLTAVRGGHYLGRPEGPEHPTESGRYILQEFSSAVLCYDTVTGQVTEGLPPFA